MATPPDQTASQLYTETKEKGRSSSQTSDRVMRRFRKVQQQLQFHQKRAEPIVAPSERLVERLARREKEMDDLKDMVDQIQKEMSSRKQKQGRILDRFSVDFVSAWINFDTEVTTIVKRLVGAIGPADPSGSGSTVTPSRKRKEGPNSDGDGNGNCLSANPAEGGHVDKKPRPEKSDEGLFDGLVSR